jgi:ribosomal protein L16 Arg81 hydroxylase
MNYSELYGTGDDAKRMKLMLLAYDADLAKQLRANPEKKEQLSTDFKKYANTAMKELNDLAASEESVPYEAKMLGIALKKNLNVAVRYDMINSVEFNNFTNSLNAFYNGQDIDLSDYLYNSESSVEIDNKIPTFIEDPTGTKRINSNGFIVR